jgi:Ca2+-binding RTX toxin-like protein
MTRFKPAAVAVLITAVVGGSIAVTLQQASASAHPGTASVWVDMTLGFHAGTGTVNTIEVKPVVGGGFTFADTTGTIELKDDLGHGCVQTTTHVLTCSSEVTLISADLQDGNDRFSSPATIPAYVYGGDGDDELSGGARRDHIEGGPGKDLIRGGYGDDDLNGGKGVDTLFGQAGNDRLTSNDLLDALWGSSGKDVLIGGATMHGDDDDDTLFPALGGEHWGGTEYDTVDFSKWTHRVNVSLDDRKNDGDESVDPDTDAADQMNIHGDVEKIIGTPYDDELIGNDEPDAIDGGAGRDAIAGRGGNDYLDAESGSGQSVYGGAGIHDTCVGFGITITSGCEH